MAQLDSELLAKITESLSGDVDTYNALINHVQRDNDQITQLETTVTETSERLTESETRGTGYLNQISNLLSRIPVGAQQQDKTVDQKLEEIKNREW